MGGRGAFSSNTLTKLNSIKTQKGKENYLSERYKDILAYPINSFKVRDWTDQGPGTKYKKGYKYDRQYNATLKRKENQNISQTIMETNLEKFIQELEIARKQRRK